MFDKKEKSENLYNRFRVGAGSISFGFFNEENDKAKSIARAFHFLNNCRQLTTIDFMGYLG